MTTRIVHSKQNARLKQLRRAFAHPGRGQQNLAGIEGPNLLAEALHAGLHIDCVFAAAPEGEQLIKAMHLPSHIEVLVMPRPLLDSALGTETPQPVAALVEPPDWTWAHVLGIHKSTAPLLLVLAGLQDPGNLGTIVRSAEAFGVDGIICLPGTVSAWNPKAVRASAGSLFRLPLLTVPAAEAFAHLREAGLKIFATTATAGHPAHSEDLTLPTAILIGNEGNGIPAELAALTDAALTIPCPGPVESLNAAVAASVLLYEASRQRSTGTLAPPAHRKKQP